MSVAIHGSSNIGGRVTIDGVPTTEKLDLVSDGVANYTLYSAQRLPIIQCVMFVYENKLHFCGGTSNPTGEYQTSGGKTHYVVADHKLTELSQLPIALKRATAFNINERVYLVGGMVSSTTFSHIIYQMNDDYSWTAVTTIPDNITATNKNTVYFNGAIHICYKDVLYRYENGSFTTIPVNENGLISDICWVFTNSDNLYIMPITSSKDQNIYMYDKNTSTWKLDPIEVVYPTGLSNHLSFASLDKVTYMRDVSALKGSKYTFDDNGRVINRTSWLYGGNGDKVLFGHLFACGHSVISAYVDTAYYDTYITEREVPKYVHRSFGTGL